MSTGEEELAERLALVVTAVPLMIMNIKRVEERVREQETRLAHMEGCIAKLMAQNDLK